MLTSTPVETAESAGLDPPVEDAEATVQAAVLQACDEAPTQFAPPLEGAGFVQVRVSVPPPHATEHAPNALHPPSVGQLCKLHGCEEAPMQYAPPLEGGGLVQVRVWMPTPQVEEHAPKEVQLPLMAAGQEERAYPLNQLPEAAVHDPSVDALLLLDVEAKQVWVELHQPQ